MNKSGLAILALVTVALAGCGVAAKRKEAFTAEMDSYLGQSLDEVIKAKGVPTATADLSNGGKVVEYSSSKMITSGGGSFTTYKSVYLPGPNGGTWTQVPVQNNTPISTSEARCKLLFTVSKDGLVENWKAEGNRCY